VAHAHSIAGGFVFDWKEELSKNVLGHVNTTFQRWTRDGVFLRPQDDKEWIRDGQLLVYKVDGIVHCPGISEFSYTEDKRGMYLRLLTLFTVLIFNNPPLPLKLPHRLGFLCHPL
jgi:hypothetical protein